jgi:hypothetical protein
MNSQLPFFSGDAASGLAVTNPESTDSEFFLGVSKSFGDFSPPEYANGEEHSVTICI